MDVISTDVAITGVNFIEKHPGFILAGEIAEFTWSPAPLPSMIVSLSLLPFTWSLAHRATPN
jgi:hypothetical protein